MGIEHVWCCECGEQTICRPEDLRFGKVWNCIKCKQTFGCLYPPRGGKVWVRISPDQVKFHNLTDEE
jgi:hypothetical protein